MYSTTKLFTSSGYLEEGEVHSANGAKLDFNKLPAFLRVLLTTDGTVTKSIESFFWERVKVENLGQETIRLKNAAPIIELDVGAPVMHRKVQLIGESSKNIYAYASSFIRAELLDADIRSRLEDGVVGIGELLRECGLETYREVMEFGQTFNQALNSIEQKSADSVWRRYRIVMNHQPFIQITEEFPLAVYQE